MSPYFFSVANCFFATNTPFRGYRRINPFFSRVSYAESITVTVLLNLYLHQLVDIPINTTLVIARPNEASIHLAKRIEEYSAKYAAGEQLGVILNKVNKQEIEPLLAMLNKYDLTTIGTIPKDDDLKNNRISKDSKVVENALEQLYYRLNIPQSEELQ